MILSKNFFYLLFLRSIYRRLKKLNLKHEYGTNPEVMMSVKQIIALSFLHPQKVVDAFFLIKNRSPALLSPFLSYFERNYIRGKFDVKFWSSFKLNRQCLPRTSNNAEAWHRKINNLSGRKKMTTLSLIQLLKDEALDAAQKIERTSAGLDWPTKAKKKDLQRAKRLHDIISGPITNIDQHIRNIANNLKF